MRLNSNESTTTDNAARAQNNYTGIPFHSTALPPNFDFQSRNVERNRSKEVEKDRVRAVQEREEGGWAEKIVEVEGGRRYGGEEE